MELDKAILQRHSVRKFTKKKPDWRSIVEAINLARLAPLAGNIASLKFIIVSDEKKIKALAEAANQDFVKQASYVVVVCSNNENTVLAYGERGRRYVRLQAGAAIENFLLKLEEEGLSTCWVGAFYDEEVRGILRIPENIDIEGIFPIGYAGEKTKQKPKPELSGMMFFETWGNKYMVPTKKLEI
jgi:nitroreductase